MSRVRARVEGTVQGVGFRPYVYRLAGELGVAGHVLNDSHGVVVEVEAAPETVEQFLVRLPAEAPPLASIDRVIAETLAETGERGFAIRESPDGGEPRAAVAPDTATCEDCLAELFDPADRRFRYPFTNCTNCGPRFTIVRGVPYDRPNTTMARFEMCAACRREYEDPARPPLPRAAERLPRVRTARAARGRGRPAGRRAGRRGRDGGRCLRFARRRDRGGEGTRRVPPRVPRRRRERRGRAQDPQAPRGQAVRADGARSRRGAASSSTARPPTRRSWPRARVRSCSPGGDDGARRGRVGRAGSPRARGDAAVFAAPSPAARRHARGRS